MGAASVIRSEYPSARVRRSGSARPRPVGLYIVEPGRRAYARRPHRFAALAAAAVGCFPPAAAPTSSIRSFSKADADVEQTGSIGSRADRQVTAANVRRAVRNRSRLCARGRRRCRSAAAARTPASLGRIRNTGAGGNITPLAASYSEGGFTCRDFLASYVRGQAQAWLQGEACRTAHGKWEVKSLTPFKQG